LCHAVLATREWRVFRFLTPIFEVNGVTALGGPEAGRTTVDFTTGVRWIVRHADEVGIGWSFPVTGRRDSDCQLLLSYRMHF